MPKILLVEDNEMNRDMLSRRLERKGFTVVCAVDGHDGLARARIGACLEKSRHAPPLFAVSRRRPAGKALHVARQPGRAVERHLGGRLRCARPIARSAA
jgi:CheY-like chemotaxis protein